MDPTSSEVRTRIFVALQRHGIALSIPAQSVFMTLEGRSRAERKRKAEVERRAAALKGVHILQPLTEDERAALSDRLTATPFRRGEVITRQGAAADHLFIITRGDVDVSLEGTNGHDRRVATLHPGDVFGEMGLMTGERRTATVTALTDVACYRLDKDAFQDVLRRRPEIAESISTLLAKRKLELDAANAGLSEEAVRSRMHDARGDMLKRIRSFFLLD
jgi:CRP-like cAMP-binding protein